MRICLTVAACLAALGCHICLKQPRSIQLGSTSFATSPVEFSAEFECPQDPNSLLFVVRGMNAEFETFCYPPVWDIGGSISVKNLSQHRHADMTFSRTNVVLGSWNAPDTTAILSFSRDVHAILDRGDRCRIDMTLTQVPGFTNKIDVMFHYIGLMTDRK